MWWDKFLNKNLNNTTMAKDTKSKVALFEMGDVSNSQKVQDTFDKLEQFVDDNNDMPKSAKPFWAGVIAGYREKTGLRVNQIVNVANITSAAGQVNRYLQTL